MIKIMIVDDEPLVRESLRRTIDWEKYGCTVAGEASDAFEGLEIYKQVRPDIIITDIVMIDSNGLDFISDVRSLNPNVGIIILSGYDDFKYAQAALKYNVAAYLLKPVSNETIIAEILKIKKNIKMSQKIQTALLAQSDMVKSDFLFELLGTETINSEILEELCHRYDIKFPSDKYCVAVFQVDETKASNMSSAFIRLKEIVNYHIMTNANYILSTVSNNELVVLYVFSLSSDTDIYNFLKNIQSDYKNSSDNTASIGVSGIFKNPAIIKRAYTQAKSALNYKASFGTNSLISYTDISTYPEQAALELSSDNINEIISGIKHRKSAAAIETVNNYFSKIGSLCSVDINSVKENISELVIAMLSELIKNPTAISFIFKRSFSPTVELQRLGTLDDIHSWIITVIKSIDEYYDSYMPLEYSPALNKAMLYIREHYSSKITVEDIAKELLVSTRSLSRLFLSETGKPFSEHLREYRIKAAVHMLETTQYKIVDIAALVGYKNIKNFYKSFKKITGCNPSYYKGKKSKENI
ncbi:MAG: response regulator [Clostridia bacterium]|nr:response regulator [Clostridia bacterium]